MSSDKLEVGEKVEITGEKSHYGLGTQWEILFQKSEGYTLISETGIDTLTVAKNEVNPLK